MSNYINQNLINIPASGVPSGTLAFKVGDHIFTAGSLSESELQAYVVVDVSGTMMAQKLSFTGTTPSDSGQPIQIENLVTFNTGHPEPQVPAVASIDFYKCVTVDTANSTWTGYKAVLSGGVYSFESTATSGLSYGDGFIPQVDKIYANGALVKPELFMGNSIPQNGLVFYASLNGQNLSTAETGQGIVSNGSPQYTTHYGIQCCYLNGSSHLQAETTNIPYSYDPISFSLWLCEDKQISGEHGIMSLGYQGNGELMAIVAANSCIRLAGHGNGWGMSGVDVPITFNYTWHHIAVVFGSGSGYARPAYVYIDGILVTSGTFACSPPTQSASLFIGSYWQDLYLSRIKGYLSSVRIYNRELTSSEISSLAAEFTPSA